MKRQRMILALMAALIAGRARADFRTDRQLAAQIDRNAVVRTRGNVEVRAEGGSVSDAALDEFTALAEKGVRDIARFTRVAPPKHIVIDLSPRVDISHTYPHFPSPDHAPRLFLDSARVADHSAPYLHELVHAILGSGGSMWLEEGFASWVASTVAAGDGGYYAPVLSNTNDRVDAQAQEVLARMDGSTTVAWFDSPAAPDFASPRERRAFYITTHSFTKFLAGALGTRTLVRIHRANDLQALARISGVSIREWERRWRRSLGNDALLEPHE